MNLSKCREATLAEWTNFDTETTLTKERLLAALDKPRKAYALLMIVNPGGSADEVQTMLMRMRDEGLVKFDINKGLWSRA
jgi:hypothetical protein